jgi:branched-chain amino acid transport system permease protein
VIPSGLVAFLAGLLFGIPALRLKGLYLALVTLALAVAAPPVIKRAEGLTGGSQGLNVTQPTAPSGLGLAQDQYLYFLCLVVAVLMFLLVASLLRSRVGRALISVRDNEIVAKSMGINLSTYKTAAFAMSSGLAGVAGAMYVWSVAFVSPESFPLTVSISFLAAVVVGGLATVAGPILGALFIVFVPEYAADVSDALAGVVYGVVLILFMIFLPHGAMGLVHRIAGRLRPRPGEPETEQEEPKGSPTATGPGTTGGGSETTKGVPAAGR